MFLGIDWEPIMPAITGALVLGTVILGIAGLYSDKHTKDGKLTRSGRHVAGFMVLLGILTVLSGLANQRIADAKERKLAEERTRQFKAQIGALRSVTGTLGGVTGSLTELQGNMRKSLGSQRELFGVAERNLGASAALQQQTQEDTVRVLRSVFEQTNRISPDRIAVLTSFQCPPTPLGINGAELYGASLTVTDAEGRQSKFFTREKLNLAAGTMFHGFVGHLGALESFSAWANARISIEFDAGSPGGMMTLDAFVNMPREQMRAWEQSLPATYICPGSATLLLNGRQVLTASSTLRHIGERGYGASFLNLRVDQDRLPRLPD